MSSALERIGLDKSSVSGNQSIGLAAVIRRREMVAKQARQEAERKARQEAMDIESAKRVTDKVITALAKDSFEYVSGKPGSGEKAVVTFNNVSESSVLTPGAWTIVQRNLLNQGFHAVNRATREAKDEEGNKIAKHVNISYHLWSILPDRQEDTAKDTLPTEEEKQASEQSLNAEMLQSDIARLGKTTQVPVNN